MSNGSNEPIEFTRGDSDRLCTIEIKSGEMIEKVGELVTKMDEFFVAHTKLVKQVDDNSRFRRVFRRAGVWLVTSSAAVAGLREIARSAGWLN